jgi:hypothetical protein
LIRREARTFAGLANLTTTKGTMSNYVESDIGAAAFLLARGFRLAGLTQLGPTRYGFSFADLDGAAPETVQAYHASATIEAKALLNSLRELKNKLYATKGSNGNGNNRHTHPR